MFNRIRNAICRRLCILLGCDCGRPPAPGKLRSFTAVREVSMTGLQCKGTFPPTTADDQALWGVRLDYTYPNPAGGDPIAVGTDQQIPSSETELLFVVPKEASGSVKLKAIDKAGNASEFGDAVPFTAHDSFPPPVPGAFSIVVTGEVPMADPEPAPVV